MPLAGFAQEGAAVAKLADLMLILREAPGSNKLDDIIVPAEPLSAADTGWFDYLGDMQLRFVFDAGASLRDASAGDLHSLQLSPSQAVRVALQNIKRVYGEPEVRRGNGGLMLIQGRSADFSASYLLDKELWQQLLTQAPGGLVVAAPKRGGLLFTPLADGKSVERLRKLIVPLQASSEQGKLSSALYLFKDGRWTIFQAPSGE
ncbi:hypothetical protein GCM10011396_03910 [Undibacterium terreum]|uniref:Uncharacterized protein n=2 Tax=Undibacterium terreum TaxID=1224302 RepID=A0A916U5R5_9BURK|nr:hypothetical protein GCM10011396_03910 [Undibacterium terreum]